MNIYHNLFRWAIKPFIGTGIGRNIIISKIYFWLAKRLLLTGPITTNNYQLYAYQKRYNGKDAVANELLGRGIWEPYTTSIFNKILKDGMVFIDIGANIGYFALLAASLVGEKGKVLAFEPEPENFRLLVNNINLNSYKNVEPHQKAISYTMGKMSLHLGTDPGTHSLFEVDSTTSECITVDVISLDDFFQDNWTKVDVVKIDVQGGELDVLKGMQNTIYHSGDIILITEFWLSSERESLTYKEYWNKLIELGFQHIYLINEVDKRLDATDFERTIDFFNSTKTTWVNLLCAKKPVYF